MSSLIGDRKFPATSWTLIVAAGDPDRSERGSALAWLCQSYWYPIYAYLRRSGSSADDAQDLTQEFFLRLLSGHYLDRANREKGPFRAFLLSSLKLFLCEERNRKNTKKRGGGATHLSFEISSGEEIYSRDPSDEETPERIFERRWARTILDHVLERLREEFVRHGRAEHFDRLKVYLVSHGEAPYAELARQLETSEGALKVGIHRLRRRYRDLLRAEIAETVDDPSQIDGELRYLAAALSKKG